MHKQNLHTHSTYCDGKDTPREMINTAIHLGFDSLGFSGHSYMAFAPNHSMSVSGTKEYRNEIRKLQSEFSDRISIFCGIEYEMYSSVEIAGFDYSIGSSHYLKIGQEYVGFDRSKQEVERIIQEYFHGNGMSFAEMYYDTLSQLPNYGKFDIIGHFDLITKHIENLPFLDENSSEYLCYASDAAKSLVGKIPYFEVNTGAIARGYRTSPYPSIPILKELKRLGFEPIISSDCHNALMLNCGFEQAKAILLHCGFRYRHILTNNGFQPVPLFD